MSRIRTDELLLGEWACLGLLAAHPAHGYDLSLRLAPNGVLGRIYSLGRPLTYRAIDQLAERGLIAASDDHLSNGRPRTIYAPTPSGRATLDRWLGQPVEHLRDVRTELLLKLTINELLGNDNQALVSAQRAAFAPIAEKLHHSAHHPQDAVDVWRDESSNAVLRFLERLGDLHISPISPTTSK